MKKSLLLPVTGLKSMFQPAARSRDHLDRPIDTKFQFEWILSKPSDISGSLCTSPYCWWQWEGSTGAETSECCRTIGLTIFTDILHLYKNVDDN